MESVEENVRQIIFSNKEQKSIVEASEIKDILIYIRNHYIYSRCMIPCVEKYFKLRLKDDAHESFVPNYKLFYYLNLQYPKMLSPFVSVRDEENNLKLQIALNDKLYDWVYKNRYDGKTTLEEIKETYQKFTDEYKIEELNKQTTPPTQTSFFE